VPSLGGPSYQGKGFEFKSTAPTKRQEGGDCFLSLRGVGKRRGDWGSSKTSGFGGETSLSFLPEYIPFRETPFGKALGGGGPSCPNCWGCEEFGGALCQKQIAEPSPSGGRINGRGREGLSPHMRGGPGPGQERWAKEWRFGEKNRRKNHPDSGGFRILEERKTQALRVEERANLRSTAAGFMTKPYSAQGGRGGAKGTAINHRGKKSASEAKRYPLGLYPKQKED